MLESSKERVELLKAGFPGNKIEQLYIISNDFVFINHPVLFEETYIKSATYL